MEVWKGEGRRKGRWKGEGRVREWGGGEGWRSTRVGQDQRCPLWARRGGACLTRLRTGRKGLGGCCLGSRSGEGRGGAGEGRDEGRRVGPTRVTGRMVLRQGRTLPRSFPTSPSFRLITWKLILSVWTESMSSGWPPQPPRGEGGPGGEGGGQGGNIADDGTDMVVMQRYYTLGRTRVSTLPLLNASDEVTKSITSRPTKGWKRTASRDSVLSRSSLSSIAESDCEYSLSCDSSYGS